MDARLREKAVTRTSIIGIAANLFLVIFKAAAGLLSGSIAIVLDAVNNLTDALGSLITIAGIKLARRSPNETHPFGYGRIEYFSTIVISLIILSAGATSVAESVKKIFAPELPTYSVTTVVIMVASVVLKLLLSSYVKRQGVRYNSDALVASSTEARFDAIISASTLLGAAVAVLFGVSIDGIIGAVISLFILKAGLEMLLEALGNVMGKRADSEITRRIKAAVSEIPGVLGAYDLVLHNYGPNSAIGSVHVEIPADMPASRIHKLTADIQSAVAEKFHVLLTVGIYAVDPGDSAREEVRSLCAGFDGVVGSHGVFIDREKQRMSFDVVVDFTVADRPRLGREIVEAVQQRYPGYQVDVHFDTNFSD